MSELDVADYLLHCEVNYPSTLRQDSYMRHHIRLYYILGFAERAIFKVFDAC